MDHTAAALEREEYGNRLDGRRSTNTAAIPIQNNKLEEYLSDGGFVRSTKRRLPFNSIDNGINWINLADTSIPLVEEKISKLGRNICDGSARSTAAMRSTWVRLA